MNRGLFGLATVLAFVGVLCLAQQPRAQMTLTGVGPGGKGASGGASPTFTNFDTQVNLSCGFVTSCTVSGLTVSSGFVTAGALVNNASGGVQTITAMTLCGTSMTLQAATNSSNGGVGPGGTSVALFYGTVSGGTCSASVTGNQTGAITRTGVSVGLLSNLSSTTPGTGCSGADQPDVDANYPCSSGITVSSGGFGVAAIGYDNATAMTSSNMTIQSQSNNTSFSVGIASTTTSNTPAFQGQGAVNGGIVAAPWR